MKSFAVKEMWRFSQLQLKEMFFYGKKKAFIQLLLLRSFSICVFCAFVSGDSLKECLSLIEQLLILLSYYYTFWSLMENMRNDKGLINKFMLSVTWAEKYVSLFVSTFLIGTVMLVGCAVLSNIFIQLAAPLFLRRKQTDWFFSFGRRLWIYTTHRAGGSGFLCSDVDAGGDVQETVQ